MKYIVWILLLSIGIYGGIFLMPYKVAEVTLNLAAVLALAGVLLGALIGLRVYKPNPIMGVFPLIPIASFFFVSGFLGVLVNFNAKIEDSPLLAFLALGLGLGLFSFLVSVG